MTNQVNDQSETWKFYTFCPLKRDWEFEMCLQDFSLFYGNFGFS